MINAVQARIRKPLLQRCHAFACSRPAPTHIHHNKPVTEPIPVIPLTFRAFSARVPGGQIDKSSDCSQHRSEKTALVITTLRPSTGSFANDSAPRLSSRSTHQPGSGSCRSRVRSDIGSSSSSSPIHSSNFARRRQGTSASSPFRHDSDLRRLVIIRQRLASHHWLVSQTLEPNA